MVWRRCRLQSYGTDRRRFYRLAIENSGNTRHRLRIIVITRMVRLWGLLWWPLVRRYRTPRDALSENFVFYEMTLKYHREPDIIERLILSKAEVDRQLDNWKATANI